MVMHQMVRIRKNEDVDSFIENFYNGNKKKYD